MCFYILSWISRNDAYASGIGMYAIGFFYFYFLLKLPFFIVIDLVILSDSLLLLLFYSREYA